MKKLTILNRKNKRKEEFTLEDIQFIYELNETIEGFGWTKDERIKKIIETRDKKKDLNVNNEIALKAVKKDGLAIEWIDKNRENYKELAMIAIEQFPLSIYYVDKNTEDYKELAMAAVKKDGLLIRWIDKNIENYKELAMAAVKQNEKVIKYIDKNIEGYLDIAKEAITSNPNAIKYIEHTKETELLFMIADELTHKEESKIKKL